MVLSHLLLTDTAVVVFIGTFVDSFQTLSDPATAFLASSHQVAYAVTGLVGFEMVPVASQTMKITATTITFHIGVFPRTRG